MLAALCLTSLVPHCVVKLVSNYFISAEAFCREVNVIWLVDVLSKFNLG